MESVLIPLAGKRGAGKFAIVDGDYDGEYFSQYRWYLMKSGYVYRHEEGKTIYLHREVSCPPTGLVVDHKNHNKLDNTNNNLRWCTQRQNIFNSNKRIDSKTLFIGVQQVRYKNSKGNVISASKWKATIDNKQIGTYDSPVAAAKARDAVVANQRGNFGILNFPIALK